MNVYDYFLTGFTTALILHNVVAKNFVPSKYDHEFGLLFLVFTSVTLFLALVERYMPKEEVE